MVPGLETVLSSTLTQTVLFEANANYCKVVGKLWPLMKPAHGFYIRKGKSLEGITSQDWARLHAGKF